MQRCTFLLLTMLLSQLIPAQVVFTIQQKGLSKDSVHEIIIGNFADVVPKQVNDSTLEYLFTPNRPEYLFIVADKTTRWVTRLWITPEMKSNGLVIDYNRRTAKPVMLSEWDLVTQKVLNFQDTKQQAKADSTIELYLSKDRDSYFSLWILRFMGDKKRELQLMDQLSPTLKASDEFRQLTAALTARKYPKPGDPFLEFKLTDKNDSDFDTKSVKNKWILLNFWTNSCGPCVKEMDDLVKLYKSIDTSKIEFISVSLDENKDTWKKATATSKIIWPSVWTMDNVYCPLCLNYNLYSMPFFILFDNNKKLIFIKDGSDELENIKKALTEIR